MLQWYGLRCVECCELRTGHSPASIMGLVCLSYIICIALVRQTLLESNTVGDLSCEFWEARKPVAAICHGVLALSRAACDEGVSPLTDTVTTTVPQFMESQAYLITR